MTNRHTGSQYNPEFGPPRYGNEEVSNSYIPRPYAYPPPPPIQNTYIQVSQPFNHALHILLDFVTCGFWLPVHMVLWATHRR